MAIEELKDEEMARVIDEVAEEFYDAETVANATHYAIARAAEKKRTEQIVELIKNLEIPNLPSGHEEFIGYGAGKHDARQAILKELKQVSE